MNQTENELRIIAESFIVKHTDLNHDKMSRAVEDLMELLSDHRQQGEIEAIKKTFPTLWGLHNQYEDEMFNLEQTPSFDAFFRHEKVQKYLKVALNKDGEQSFPATFYEDDIKLPPLKDGGKSSPNKNTQLQSGEDK